VDDTLLHQDRNHEILTSSDKNMARNSLKVGLSREVVEVVELW